MKRNKALKRCHLCSKQKEKDKRHGTEWIGCFRCSTWACYRCMPNQFKKACSEVYKCVSCVALSVADGQPDGLPDIDMMVSETANEINSDSE